MRELHTLQLPQDDQMADQGFELYQAFNLNPAFGHKRFRNLQQPFRQGGQHEAHRKYEYPKGTDTPWKVQVFNKDDELLFLFDKLYSRLDWETRLALPEGVTTWLHGFFSSHREPFDHKIETLAVGAGLTLDSAEDEYFDEVTRIAKRKTRLREAKRIITKALEAL